MKQKELMERIDAWSAAVTEILDVLGMVSDEERARLEARLISTTGELLHAFAATSTELAAAAVAMLSQKQARVDAGLQEQIDELRAGQERSLDARGVGE